jgi:hypothetical protein
LDVRGGRRFGRILVVVTAVSIVASCNGWPHFRGGPTLAGVAVESSIGVGNVGSLVERWRGSGPVTSLYDSPVVTGGRVYTGAAVYDVGGGTSCTGDPAVCAPQWQLPSLSHDLLAPTTVAGGRQYRLPPWVPDGSLSAFDAAGVEGCGGTPKVCQPVRSWSHTVPEVNDDVYGMTAPVVVGSTLYTGSLESAVGVDLASDAGCAGVPTTCPVTWAAPGVAPIVGTAVSGGTAYYVGMHSPPDYTGAVFALDAAGSVGCGGTPKLCQPLWTGDLGLPSDKSQAAAMPPTVVDGKVYALASWQNVPVNGHFDGPAVAELKVFDAAGVDGCAGTPKVCQPLWSAPLPGSTRMWTGAAVHGGRVYVPTEGGVSVFDANGVVGCGGSPKVCSPIATMSFGWWPGTRGAVTIANGVAYVGSMDGLFAFDANLVEGCSGAPLVCQPVLHVLGGTNVTTPAVVAGQVHVLSDGQVVTLGLP